jgi:hypothetical protein
MTFPDGSTVSLSVSELVEYQQRLGFSGQRPRQTLLTNESAATKHRWERVLELVSRDGGSSVEDIARQVYGNDDYLSKKNVYVRINDLRKKRGYNIQLSDGVYRLISRKDM